MLTRHSCRVRRPLAVHGPSSRLQATPVGRLGFNSNTIGPAFLSRGVDHTRMDRARLTKVFNLAFRRGASDRDAAGLTPSSELRPLTVPQAPSDCVERTEQRAWTEGYETGYQVGASDAQLSSVDIPGAHGMVSGFGEEFLEMFGFFKRVSDETRA